MQAPEFFTTASYYGGDQSHFAVDDLLNFPNEGDAIMSDGFFDSIAKTCAGDSPAFTPNHSSNSSSSTSAAAASYRNAADSHFSTELCVPYDDMAELEWLSNFVDESYSMDPTLETNLHMLQIGSKPTATESTDSEPSVRNANNAMFHNENPLPGKARSKRSRAAPGNWTARLLHLTPSTKGSDSNPNPASHPSRKGAGSGVRRCLHCATEKTPQWRTGPMGPKTLCNACGVRYTSGRLVPEYRPAASPTFVPAKHSNSHRKVVELRRQREAAAHQEQLISQSSIFGASNGGDEFLVHHHHHHFRHMI